MTKLLWRALGRLFRFFRPPRATRGELPPVIPQRLALPPLETHFVSCDDGRVAQVQSHVRATVAGSSSGSTESRLHGDVVRLPDYLSIMRSGTPADAEWGHVLRPDRWSTDALLRLLLPKQEPGDSAAEPSAILLHTAGPFDTTGACSDADRC